MAAGASGRCCRLCAAAHGAGTRLVDLHGWVAAGYPEQQDVPGAVICMLRRHVERLSELHDDEAAGMGIVAQRVSAAIDVVVGPEKIYMLMFLEQTPHLHFVLLPRPAGVSLADRSAQFVLDRARYVDEEDARHATVALQLWLQATTEPTIQPEVSDEWSARVHDCDRVRSDDRCALELGPLGS